MEQQLTFQQQIPIKKQTDVFIAGGGPSGVAAAVAAARNGASVYLIESGGCFGGLGTAGMVPCYMQFTDGIHFLAGGIGKEVSYRLQQLSDKDPDADANAIQTEVLKRVYDKIMTEAGVDFRFFSSLIGVIKKGGKAIDAAVVSSKSGLYAVKAKVYIDCTGDGDLSVMAGADFSLGDENGACMPSTLCSLWAGLDWASIHKPDQAKYLEQAFLDQVFTVEDRHLTGLSHSGKSFGGGNIGHAYDVDGTDEADLTRAMVEQRQRLTEFEYYYRNYIPGCEDAEIVGTGSILGVRESRRITCDYTLNIDDYLKRAAFEDEIGRYAYPVDIHPKTADKAAYEAFEKEYRETYKYRTGESYGIPYRSLVVKEFDNLLVAGRCLGVDQKVQASIRTMPGCYITGQAAGVAAALAALNDTGTREIDIRDLQRRLKNLGGYLPNYQD